jgi:phosphatidylserine/phosphatidylglycerophosphate/cardiolipin synthase-like enzyme
VSPEPVASARRWAKHLPREFARRLADALRAGPDAVRALQVEAVLPESAAAVRAALELAEMGEGPFTAGLLTSRLDIADEQPHLTPVWTGPQSEALHKRLTLAVLADLIDEAQHEILLVSYATVPSNDVRSALDAAASRGVEITMLLERNIDNPQFNGLAEPFPHVAARRLCWPSAVRPSGASMHAKLLIVDRGTALVGSANLTGFGLERNLECGLLVRGGPVPRLLAEHVLSAQGLEEAAQP